MSSQIALNNMISQQLRTGDVLEKRVLALYETLPREDFLPNEFKSFAYSDLQIPLAHHQRMLTPLEEGLLLQALALQGHETVLEVGTGTGFLTALLSRLCKKVISIDYYAEFTTSAQKHLEKHQCTNVELITGNACQGWLDLAPYDVMVFTGAIESLTQTHRLQLLTGGKLFAIVGHGSVMQGQLHTLNHDSTWQERVIFETNIPLLIDKLRHNDFVF